MKSGRRFVTSALFRYVILGLPLWVTGSPILPGGRDLPDEVYSLVGLRKINTIVEPVPQDLGRMKGELDKVFCSRFKDAGFEICDDSDALRMTLHVQASTDPDRQKAQQRPPPEPQVRAHVTRRAAVRIS